MSWHATTYANLCISGLHCSKQSNDTTSHTHMHTPLDHLSRLSSLETNVITIILFVSPCMGSLPQFRTSIIIPTLAITHHHFCLSITSEVSSFPICASSLAFRCTSSKHSSLNLEPVAQRRNKILASLTARSRRLPTPWPFWTLPPH